MAESNDINHSHEDPNTASTQRRRPSLPPLDLKYLRAMHDYHPENKTISGSSGGISITVPLREADIVLIHITHANGWADGTILSTGVRGWIPTNYCKPYDPHPIRHLLQALISMWSYLSMSTADEALSDDRQDHVQRLVAGVRRLLEYCDCLHRDDALVKSHVGLRRCRKSLLADLSTLLKDRDDIRNTFSDPVQAVEWSTVDQYLFNAFKVACRGARFLDIWTQCTSPEEKHSCLQNNQASESSRAARKSIPLSDVESYTESVKSTPTFQLRVIEFDDTIQDDDFLEELDLDQVLKDPHDSILNYSALPVSSPKDLGLTFSTSGGPVPDLASERLAAAHEQFLGDIAAFIGLHLHSRTSLDLAKTTQLSVKAAEEMLLVVGEIAKRSPSQSQSLSVASDKLRTKLSALRETAKHLCEAATEQGDSSLVGTSLPDNGRGLVAAATACVRAAGDCTAKTRKFLDHTIGDFIMMTASQEQHKKSDRAHLITPTVVTNSGNWTDVVPGATNPQNRNLPQRPANLLRSTTDDSNNFTLSSVSPAGNMRRPNSTPSPLIILPTSTEPPLKSPPPASNLTEHHQHWTPSGRKGSLGRSTIESSSADQDSLRNSAGSVVSPTSTRATTPDRCQRHVRANPSLSTFASGLSGTTTTMTDDGSDHDGEVLMKSYAHELLYNKDGQVVGGTLEALVEKLTNQYAPPDPDFHSAFLLTFRLFADAVELAQTLIDRYQYAGDCNTDSSPARLRVYNFFKAWLESHYLAKSDAPALDMIRSFAKNQLSQRFPGPGKRLADLTDKAAELGTSNTANQLVSAVGKTCVSLGTDYEKTLIPHAKINREQLYLLTGDLPSRKCSFLDLDPMEIARQLTLMESRIFCAIQPQELLGLEWTKKDGRAKNVLAMSTFSTNLTNLVVDTILTADRTKKRVETLKQWIKISKICLEINNYSALMAITCSLTTSAVSRLRQSWDQLPAKTKAVFEELKEVVDVSRNYAALRQCLQTPKAPCLPFVGMYLTDLTFVDVGNANTRLLPNNNNEGESAMVINFDKHMRSARIISQLQRYQIVYRLQNVPEIQEWLEEQLERVHTSDQCTVMSFWRRSQALESRGNGEEHRDSVEEKERVSGGGFVGSMKTKASVSGLNAFVHKSKNDFFARVRTGGSGNNDAPAV